MEEGRNEPRLWSSHELLKQWTLTANVQMLSQTSFELYVCVCVSERKRSSNFGHTRLSNPQKESGGAGRSQDTCHRTGSVSAERSQKGGCCCFRCRGGRDRSCPRLQTLDSGSRSILGASAGGQKKPLIDPMTEPGSRMLAQKSRQVSKMLEEILTRDLLHILLLPWARNPPPVTPPRRWRPSPTGGEHTAHSSYPVKHHS